MAKTNDVPVGTVWQYTAPDGPGIIAGATGRIWLEKVFMGSHGQLLMVWRWSFKYADGSGLESDWTPNYRTAADECATRFGGACRVRFRRVK